MIGRRLGAAHHEAEESIVLALNLAQRNQIRYHVASSKLASVLQAAAANFHTTLQSLRHYLMSADSGQQGTARTGIAAHLLIPRRKLRPVVPPHPREVPQVGFHLPSLLL